MFSMARSKFLKEIKYLEIKQNEIIQEERSFQTLLEGYFVQKWKYILPPNPRFVGWFDFIIQMVQNDVIYEFIPAEYGSYVVETSFSYFHSKNI